MFAFIIRRIFSSVLTLLCLITLTFFLLRLAPGGPFDTDRVWPPEIEANIKHKYGLDIPVPLQFLHWLSDVARGDLRESFQYIGEPVSRIIANSLPASVLLGGVALLVAVIIGAPLGCAAAWKEGSLLDRGITFFSVSGLSFPTYLLASLLILFLSLKLEWLPPALWESPSSAVLPILTLSLRPLAMIVRLVRVSMLETLKSDYIRTAYGKGLSDLQVLLRHALRNSIIPAITILGPIAANLITGSFIVEFIFQVPGLGKHFVQSVLNRDYPLVMGITLVYGSILILTHILMDLAYLWVDPRIRLEESHS